MFFVERSDHPHRPICAAYSTPQYPAQEGEDNDPDLQRYINRSPLAQRLASVGLSTELLPV